MANCDEMMAKIKCKGINADLISFYYKNIEDVLKEKEFSEEIIRVYTEEKSYLGNLALLFVEPDEVDSFTACYETAWRSFVCSLAYVEENSELIVYFYSGDNGSEEFFRKLFKEFKNKIDSIDITISDQVCGEDGEDLEYLINEYGENFIISIRESDIETSEASTDSSEGISLEEKLWAAGFLSTKKLKSF